MCLHVAVLQLIARGPPVREVLGLAAFVNAHLARDKMNCIEL